MPDKVPVPAELPVLPVRDTVLFPGGVMPLTVGRESSLALLNSLEGEERLLAVISQLDPRVEDPTDVDLHRVGTMAKLHKTVKMPNGNLVVFVEGLSRIRLAGLMALKPFMRANVEPVAGHCRCATTRSFRRSNATRANCFATWWGVRRSFRTTCRRWL